MNLFIDDSIKKYKGYYDYGTTISTVFLCCLPCSVRSRGGRRHLPDAERKSSSPELSSSHWISSCHVYGSNPVYPIIYLYCILPIDLFQYSIKWILINHRGKMMKASTPHVTPSHVWGNSAYGRLDSSSETPSS